MRPDHFAHTRLNNRLNILFLFRSISPFPCLPRRRQRRTDLFGLSKGPEQNNREKRAHHETEQHPECWASLTVVGHVDWHREVEQPQQPQDDDEPSKIQQLKHPHSASCSEPYPAFRPIAHQKAPRSKLALRTLRLRFARPDLLAHFFSVVQHHRRALASY